MGSMSHPELELLYILTVVVVAQNYMHEWGKERVGQTERIAWKHIHTTCKRDSK